MPALTASEPNALGQLTLDQEVLRDPSRPVHAIADHLLPYLQVLIDQFQPHKIVLYGSYANGQPRPDSDIDLLVIKDIEQSPLQDSMAIRRAWRPLHDRAGYLSIHLLMESPAGHLYRIAHAAGFYDTILRTGIRLA